MSINVTVNGNPISIRRGKMIFSDLENLKKNEEKHLKRLRLEQVQEQSKAFSKGVLERARQIRQEQLDRLEEDECTEMRRAHEQRLMELHSRYQDIDNIGYAHENASRQPDVDSIKELEEQRNREKAKERGSEATERIKEALKKLSPHSKHVERLRGVRELENERSNMVSRLPKRPSESIKCAVPKSKTAKYVVSKKTPIKKIKETLPKISVSISNSDEITNIKTTKKKSTETIDEIKVCESDEPRKTVPKFNTENKSSNLISSAATSSSSISDDSSYFSDNGTKSTKQPTSSSTTKVTSYDHEYRHKHTYERPSGLVERIDDKDKPSANDLAQEMVSLENQISSVLTSQEETSHQRCQDAVLREKIRRDYEILLKKLDDLSKKEKKYEGEQCASTNQRLYAPSKKSDDLAKRQTQMDRVFKSILQSSREPPNTELIDRAERPITLPPRDQVHPKRTPSCWKELYEDEEETDESSLDDGNEYTRKRKISELLIKIEKMKRRLLQEYGPDLPENLFNASLNSLFKNQTVPSCNKKLEQKQTQTLPVTEPKTKENKFSNTRCTNTCNKSIAKSLPKKLAPRPKNACVQTSTKSTPVSARKNIKSTCHQEVQVELHEKKLDKVVETEKQYPLEPIVTIAPTNNTESVSSSSLCSSNSSVSTDVIIGVSKKELTIISKDKSSMKVSKNTTAISSVQTTTKTPVKICFDGQNGNESYQIAGLVIDTSMKEITVIPKKSKESLAEASHASPVITGSCHSLPGSRNNTPSKKQFISAPPTRRSSPRKSPIHQSNKYQAKISESKYQAKYTQVSNSSNESSQLNSSETSNFYRFQALASKKTITQFQDTSDASTAYPSPLAHGILNASDNTNTILEFLDSSTNESLKKRLNDVSPVSSPETPSPRTMLVPSNLPKSGKANKCLKFSSQQTTKMTNLSNVNNFTHSCSTSKYKPTTISKTVARTRCTCKNPECKLMHDKIEDSQTHLLKYCPEVLKKYEEMQNICAGRIASLTDLIQKVRNEQKGLEFLTVTNDDSNSMSQIISSTQISSNGDININDVVKKMESVSAQVKKTLMDSRQIISGEGVTLCEAIKVNKEKLSPISKNTSSISESSEEKTGLNRRKCSNPPTVVKPKILRDEKVNIKLDRFQCGQNSKRTCGGADNIQSKVTSVEVIAAAGLTSSNSDQNDDMVKMLSKEILEQSKSLNKSPNDNLKNSDDSSLKSSQALVNDLGDSSKVDAENQENIAPELLNINSLDFVPFLAGIPKVSRGKNSSTTRGRPPVTLISGPYRQEMDLESPAHELSTIVEFDTPDTAKKSQVSTRSPSNKVRKKLQTSENLSTLSPKKTDMKVTKSKPSVHVAPLPAHRSPHISLNVSNKSGSKSIEKSPRNSFKKSVEKSSESLEHKKLIKSTLKNSNSSDSMHSLPDILIENLQASRENTDANYDFRINQISELHSLPDESIDQILVSEICEESTSKRTTPVPRSNQEQSKEKIKKNKSIEEKKGPLGSTSSTSLSGLSGISEISTTPSSEALKFKCPSSPEEMEQALKKWGLGWATTTLKKTREASALGSSSSSDGTPVNTGTRLVSPLKKHHQDGATPKELPDLSDVSSISIKHANKSTERSVLVRGRTSTPNGQEKNETPNNFSQTNSDETLSTLGSFSSDLNIIVQNQSADMTVPNISFSNSNL